MKTELYSIENDGPYATFIQKNGENYRFQWQLSVNPHGNIMPPTIRTAVLSWDPSSFNNIHAYFLRKQTGEVVVKNMRETKTYKVTGDDSEQKFIIEAGYPPEDINLNSGWDMISLPIIPDTTDLASLFPEAVIAYAFDQSYQETTQLKPGKGYWIKTTSNLTYTITGQAFDYYSINLSQGWHLIGCVNDTVIPRTNPENQISVIYGFDNFYYITNRLEKGKAYWIKVKESCELILDAR